MKNKINYKYINLLAILGVIYLLYLMKDLWIGVVGTIISIALPFIVAFSVAYVLYPFLKFMTERKIPKSIGVVIIVLVVVLIIGIISYFVIPLFANQLINLLSNLGKVTSDIATRYGVNLETVNEAINKYSNIVVDYIGEAIKSGSIFAVLNNSINFATKFIIAFIVSIYFLSGMPSIRSKVKKFLLKSNYKKFKLISTIDKEVYSYLKGLGIFMIIQFFEYTFLFLIIGHPNFLLLGFLACVTTVIPYFGGILTNAIALLIATVVSPKVFILTLVITLVFPNIDGYIISPRIYDKTNQLPPLLTIFVVFAGGALLGFTGIVIAVPLTIIITAIIRAYKGEISKKISNIKEKI